MSFVSLITDIFVRPFSIVDSSHFFLLIDINPSLRWFISLPSSLNTRDVKLPFKFFGGRFGQGQSSIQKIQCFRTQPKIVVHPLDFKNHCPYNFEGHSSTNPILSTLHLQGPKSNIYVHFHLVKNLISNWNNEKKHVINLEVKTITKPSLALRL